MLTSLDMMINILQESGLNYARDENQDTGDVQVIVQLSSKTFCLTFSFYDQVLRTITCEEGEP